MFDVQTQNLEPGTPNLVLCRVADFLEAAGPGFYATARLRSPGRRRASTLRDSLKSREYFQGVFTAKPCRGFRSHPAVVFRGDVAARGEVRVVHEHGQDGAEDTRIRERPVLLDFFDKSGPFLPHSVEFPRDLVLHEPPDGNGTVLKKSGAGILRKQDGPKCTVVGMQEFPQGEKAANKGAVIVNGTSAVAEKTAPLFPVNGHQGKTRLGVVGFLEIVVFQLVEGQTRFQADTVDFIGIENKRMSRRTAPEVAAIGNTEEIKGIPPAEGSKLPGCLIVQAAVVGRVAAFFRGVGSDNLLR